MLKVWLPLNEDLHNQGISDAIVTNNGATVDNNGKIGKCYNFAKNAYLDINKETMQHFSNAISICFWIKVNSWNTNWDTFFQAGKGGTAWTQYHIGILRNSANYLCWTLGDGSTASNANYQTGNITVGQWTHVACTYGEGQWATYLNGTLSKSGTTTIVPNFSNITSIKIGGLAGAYKCDCLINDFRVYDHALSAAEVKEIAQGLVLHYKLDSRGPSLGNPNLLIDSKVPTAGNGASGIVKSITEDGLQKVVADTSNGNWVTFSNHNTTLALSKGDTFTFSLKIKSDNSIKKPTVYFQSGMGYFSMQGTMSPNWSIIYYTGTWNIDNLQTNIHLGFGSAPGTYYIEYFKLEKGDSYTSWAPAAGEYLSDLNYIEDSSGYNHNGEILNDVLISSDTPRYSTSTNLVAGNSAINCGRGGMVTDSITVNLWLKSSTWANPVSCTESGGWNFESSGDYFRFPVYISGVGYKYGVSATKRTELCNNQWHMLTGVYDRINGHIKIYVDGELDNDYNAGTTNAIGYHGSNVIWLGAEASGSSTAIGSNDMAGLFSDFRIYCTPLLDTDIKQLYNVSMKVDKGHNIHVYEFQEQNINLFSSLPWTASYSTHSTTTNLFTNYNTKNEPQFVANGTSAGSDFVEITPGIYEYDYTISVNAGNQFYIGFERYDADKTSRSNAACVYTYATKPSSDVVEQRYKGTVDLSTDGVNPIKYITLRILNGWSGTTSGVTGQATIHNFSLKLKSVAINPSLKKTGQLINGEMKEQSSAKFYKDHIIEANQFIER